MDNVIGFIIFLVIVVVSIVNKIITESKAAQERSENPDRPLSPAELPEATRRMLYGDADGIPVAKPRQPEVARRRQVSTQQAQPHPVSARRVEVEDDMPPPPRPVPVVQTQQVQPPQRVPSPPMRQPMQQPARRPMQTPQQIRPQQRTSPKPVRTPAPTPTRTARKPAAQPAPARMLTTPGTGITDLAGVFVSKNELARAVLLREILGPPKAFEDFG